MPRNAEYLIATYAIVGVAISFYTLRVMLKLKQIKNKLKILEKEH